jgi:nucleotide-binding universal stress UspA family protein
MTSAPAITRHIILPIDGSANALLALEYVHALFGAAPDMELIFVYILPALPPILADARDLTAEEQRKLRAVDQKNHAMAERFLAEARARAVEKGFEDKRLKTIAQERKVSVTQDICQIATSHQTNAVVLARRGRTNASEIFAMGEVSAKMVDFCRSYPVWIVNGTLKSDKVLVAVDCSENALRAVDHAGFMLGATGCELTLFHTTRSLRGYMPQEIIEGDPALEELWRRKEGQQIAPYMTKARELLQEAGIDERRLRSIVVAGSRSPAEDILAEARRGGYGTLVLGRRGLSKAKAFFVGSVTNRILQEAVPFAVCIVQ